MPGQDHAVLILNCGFATTLARQIAGASQVTRWSASGSVVTGAS